MYELKNAIERGVKVKMIMDYENNIDSKITKQLIESGAEIIFWKPNEKLHAKFMIIDNQVFTGSFNLTVSKRHLFPYNKEELEKLLLTKTQQEIADEIGFSIRTIYRWVKKYGIEWRARGRSLPWDILDLDNELINYFGGWINPGKCLAGHHKGSPVCGRRQWWC